MTPSRPEVLEWLQDWIGTTLPPVVQADVLHATGREGAEADALVAAFAAQFGVDMTGYQPRMHCRSNGQALRPDWPFPVPPVHGAVVPLSVSLLHAAAVARRWPVTYPKLPVVRGLSVGRDLSVANVPLLMAGLIAATLLVLWAVPVAF